MAHKTGVAREAGTHRNARAAEYHDPIIFELLDQAVRNEWSFWDEGRHNVSLSRKV
ncbi:hypothetical protein [Sphingobium tyrosinilyticum]|uniref:Uncharacterized protein n=1 Tax=Sphingobium tyrosinilyticum TaxID=2715436 RepID=A0ABV9EVL4_9SPHN